jgi:hypothetical protein
MKSNEYRSFIQVCSRNSESSQYSCSIKKGSSPKPVRLFTTLMFLIILSLLIFSLTTSSVHAKDDIVIRRGETITITVVLLQNGTYGNPVPDQMIDFFDQTHNWCLGTDITDTNGVASIDWHIPYGYPLGPALINATFHGNESLFLSPSAQWTILHVVSSVQLVINYNVTTLAPEDQFSFTVLLLDDVNMPVENASLVVFKGNSIIASSNTNSSGLALFTLQCNTSWSDLGENTIRVVHQEDLVNSYASAEESFTITIRQIVTSIDVVNYPDKVALGGTLGLEASLSGSEGGISAQVGVSVDNAIIDSITTDTFGSCSYNFSIDTRFLPGIHTLRLVYNGSERFASSFTEFQFGIVSPAYLDINIPKTLIVGNVTEFRICVLDYYNRPFSMTKIRLSDLTSISNSTSEVSYSPPISSVYLSIDGPPGPHSLEIKLVNSFITNSTYPLFLLVWSRPIIILDRASILNFASPNQEIAFAFEMTGLTGKCINKGSQILINGFYKFSVSTNDEGIASFTILAPSSEGSYNLTIIYAGNVTLYDLSAKYEYLFIVSHSIPVQAELIDYEVVPPLQEIRLNLRIRCLNGTLLSGTYIRFIWLTNTGTAESQEEGVVTLHLTVPQTSGNYSLYYEVDGSHGLLHSSGSIEVAIFLQEILASQGVGIEGFILSFIISFCAILVSLVKQHVLDK